MPYILVFLLLVLLTALLMSASPKQLAQTLRLAGPVLLLAAGGLLTAIGRGGIGIPIAGIGLALWSRLRQSQPVQTASPAGQSTVRTAMLEMNLDHETGDLDGTVLTGEHEGKRLSVLDEELLLHLFAEMSADRESGRLLEAYLDRRIPGWREHADADNGAWQGSPSGSGAMTKQEAYQILGLSPGADPQEIRKAHHRLMKRVHPDGGGSTFLASKINEAKDVLLD
ncbi:MAG: DnaJ domain-containing protein [Rhizobiaceae bacterium]